jgi:hypothetical protein
MKTTICSDILATKYMSTDPMGPRYLRGKLKNLFSTFFETPPTRLTKVAFKDRYNDKTMGNTKGRTNVSFHQQTLMSTFQQVSKFTSLCKYY